MRLCLCFERRDWEFIVIACAVSALLAYYSGLMFGDDDRNTQCFQQMAALEFVVLICVDLFELFVMALAIDITGVTWSTRVRGEVS